MLTRPSHQVVFFFNDTATTEIYTLPLHDALPICQAGGRDEDRGHPVRARGRQEGGRVGLAGDRPPAGAAPAGAGHRAADADRKSTRLNSSHLVISYAVFCLKKKRSEICSRLSDGR